MGFLYGLFLKNSVPYRISRQGLAALIICAAVFMPQTVDLYHKRVIEALAPYEAVVEGFREGIAVVVDDHGEIYVSDRERGKVFKISGSSLEVVVSGLARPVGLAFDFYNRLLIVEEGKGRVLRVETEGSVTEVVRGIRRPRWIAVGGEGTVYLTAEGLLKRKDRHKERNGDKYEDDDKWDDGDEERKEDDGGGEVILCVAGSSSAPSVVAGGFKRVEGIVVAKDSLYVASRGYGERKGGDPESWRHKRSGDHNHEGVYRIPVESGCNTGPVARFSQTEIEKPLGMALDALGALYVSAKEIEVRNGSRRRGKKKDVVVKVDAEGAVTPFAWELNGPGGMAFDRAGNLYVAVNTVPQESYGRGERRGRRDSGGVMRFEAPLPPEVVAPVYTNASSVLVAGNAVPGSRIDLFFNDADDPVFLVTEDGSFSLGWLLYPNVENRATVWGTSHHGLGLTGAPVEIGTIHDDMLPIVEFLQPGLGRALRGTATIEARASDSGSGIGNVEIRAAGQVVGSVLSQPLPADLVTATAFWNTETAPDGIYAVEVSAVDQAGNSRTITRLVTADNTPPDTEIVDGPEGTVTGASFTFTVSGTDNLGQPQDLEFAWRIDSGDFTPFTSQTEISFNDLGPGDYVFEVVARDPAGNIDPSPASRAFTVTALTVQITEPIDEAAVAAGTLLIRGTVEGGAAEVGVTVNGFVAAVQGNIFSALVPVSIETTTIAAAATTSAGNTVVETINISVIPAQSTPVILIPNPESGVVPLTVSFSLLGGPTPGSIDLDFDGDGNVDFSGSSLDGQVFTYLQPGIYIPVVTVYDPQGNQFTGQAVVQVYDQSVLDTILHAKWTGLKDALRMGDITAGLNFIVTGARKKYEEAFRIIEAILPNIDAVLTDVTLIEVRERSAIYEASRVDNGLAKSFEVRFALDVDGIWRLEAF